MSDKKYTPGPWSVSEANDLPLGATLRVVRIRGGESRLRICDMDTISDDAEANARLIAAAPELVEALEDALRMAMFEGAPFRPWHNAARAALAKALG